MPRVSVIIPNYNHARFLVQRIESVLSQTYRDFDLLLLDDCSPDDSLSILRRYAEREGVGLIENTENSGSPFVQWNKGVSEVSGELVWIAESDDFATPNLLERLVAKFDEHADLSLAYCASQAVDENGEPMAGKSEVVEKLDRERWKADFVNDGQREIEGYLSRVNTIPNASSVLFKREAYLDAGGADVGYRLMGDWVMWLRLMKRGRVGYVAERMNFHRWHAGTVRTDMGASARRLREMYDLMGEIDRAVSLSAGRKREMRYAAARSWMWNYWLIGSGGSDGFWANQKEIYASARRVDPRLGLNLFTASVSAMADRLGLLGVMRRVLGRSG